ncbi:murein DD-endopeptidase MepM/ murein hydrolase activator NlpD [Rhizobium sp. BK251]|nr:murein DD-endopeptidase MepM/ murein hydrolase activator NlpD [Rhizobium sp. BK251]
MTTGAIPQRGYGAPPNSDAVPLADVSSGGYGMQSGYPANQQTYNQPYPAQAGGGGYAPNGAPPAAASSARMASAPVSVQRAELAAPGAAAPSAPANSSRDVAMAQPFPTAPKVVEQKAPKLTPDPLTTGTTKVSGWSAANAPSVMLRPGETVATLSRRYGVPEKEILRVNGLKNSASAAPGQQIIIPTFNGGNAAKAASQAADLSKGGKPQPGKSQEQNLAVLPGSASARDKAQGDAGAAGGKLAAGAGKDPGAGGGSYIVKPGDSLAKIARATGTSVDDLKAANQLTAGTIRIGQALKIPGRGATSDQLKTASIPVEKASVKAQAAPVVSAVQTTSAEQPAPYKPPVATQSVSDVEKKSDVASAAPESTGIGKYRWPVRGAVVAGFGANVDGNRNDGIDISVPEGTPIKAAENGVVIYAGNGLKELGNTVLLRHDDGTVTVYGHADALSVSRGQKVQRGQTLATSGMSGSAKRPQVHFEVRKDASPVNPMTFLE